MGQEMRLFDPGPESLANSVGIPYTPPYSSPFLSADSSSVSKADLGPISSAD